MNTTTNDRKAGVEVMDKAMGMRNIRPRIPGQIVILQIYFSVDKGRN